ncbi:MAG TPA: Hsp20/alpha crystallin family protein [Chitinophagales bacterium]|nr:Hsp20/alpha crystallin family protein [Chitinophagales bacterium]
MALKKSTKSAAPKKKAVPVKKAVKPAVTPKPAAAVVKKETAIVSSPFWNIWDAGKQYKVRVSVPGLGKNNIQIHVNGNHLTISSEKEKERKKETKNYLVREYVSASWSKTIALPQKVNEKDVKISYKDGVLKIGLTKV